MDRHVKGICLVLLWAVILLAFAGCGFLPASSVPEKPAEKELPGEIPEVIVPEISFMAAGDVMLARKLNRLISQKGMEYPFLHTTQFLAGADIAFANLESPLSDQGAKIDGKEIWFRGKPENVQALSGAGFDVLSLANNHALDYDSPALLQTMELLGSAGIVPVGGGKDIGQARSPAVIEREGIKVAFLAYSEMADVVWSYTHPRMLQATEEVPGIAPLVVEQIKEDMVKIRDQVDYIFISLHWGVEYEDMPEAYQRDIAHQLIDAGADMILGHHPHCLQGVELYQGRLIAYSLGNFVFDQNWSEKTKEGLLLHVTMDPASVREAELLPIYVNDGQPAVAEGDRAAAILQRTKNISEKLGTKLEIKEGRGVVISGDQDPDGGRSL